MKRNKHRRSSRTISAILVGIASILLLGCSTQPSATAQPQELILFDWTDDIPLEIIDEFEDHSGVHVNLVTFESAEEAIARIEDGLVFDVAVIEGDVIPTLLGRGLLAEIDHAQVPNMNNIDPAFRDLAYDPDNVHSIPYSWGTVGLLVRTDLAGAPVTHWADLWDPQYAGRVAIRAQPTEMISASLISLGYHLNSQEPQQLEAALHHLQELDTLPGFIDTDSQIGMQAFLDSNAVLMVGWQEDAMMAIDMGGNIDYILPEEGCMLWSDNYVISSQSSNLEAAHAFIDFMLIAEVSARIVNEKYYPTANAAAIPLIDEEILENPIIFPARADLAHCEWFMPFSDEGDRLYQETWQQYIDTLDW